MSIVSWSICDSLSTPEHDHDIEQLLQFCLVPYLEDQQVKTLKELARQAKVPLIRVLKLEKALRRANITREQESALQQHLAVITGFQSDSSVSQIEEALWAIVNGPFAVLAEEEQKMDDVKEVLRHLRHKTILEAVAEIKQHLSFLEEEQKHTGLIVTTIDHAKSEEFDTVFLLGADFLGGSPNPGILLTYKRRLYVGISRARRRLYLVVGGHQVTNPLLSSIPEHLYNEVIWSPMVYQMQDKLCTIPLAQLSISRYTNPTTQQSYTFGSCLQTTLLRQMVDRVPAEQ